MSIVKFFKPQIISTKFDRRMKDGIRARKMQWYLTIKLMLEQKIRPKPTEVFNEIFDNKYKREYTIIIIIMISIQLTSLNYQQLSIEHAFHISQQNGTQKLLITSAHVDTTSRSRSAKDNVDNSPLCFKLLLISYTLYSIRTM